MYLFIGVNPINVYQIIFSKALGDRAGWGEVLYRATPLIFTGLAVALAFQCGYSILAVKGKWSWVDSLLPGSASPSPACPVSC